MKFCLLENKKVAWYQRLCTIETIILKRRKKRLLYYLWYHDQFEPNFIASLVSCLAVSSPVTCLHLSWWDLTVMQIITPCVATKLIVCYLLQNAFFVTFNSLVVKNVFVTLINCYFIVHVFGIFSFMQGFWYFARSWSHEIQANLQNPAKFPRNRLIFPRICPKKSCDLWLFLPRPVRSPVYGRTFLKSNWENCEHQKHFWNVIVL